MALSFLQMRFALTAGPTPPTSQTSTATVLDLHDGWSYVDHLDAEYAAQFLDSEVPRNISLLSSFLALFSSLWLFLLFVEACITAVMCIYLLIHPEEADNWNAATLGAISFSSFLALYFLSSSALSLVKYGRLVVFTIDELEVANLPVVYEMVKFSPRRSNIPLHSTPSFQIDKEMLSGFFQEHSEVEMLALVDTGKTGKSNGIVLALRGTDDKYSHVFR